MVVELDFSSKFFTGKREKDITTRSSALKLLEKIRETINKSDKSIQNISLCGLVDDEGKQIHEINIDLYGILRVEGAIIFRESSGIAHTLIVVDEGASYLLFELIEDKAFFHGALTGIELDGFLSSVPGKRFSYYRRVYKKLADKHIFDLIDPYKVYRYETGEAFESPRKAVRVTV